jgi:hypothetical protein
MGDQNAPGGISRTTRMVGFRDEKKVRMNKIIGSFNCLKLALTMALLAGSAGCVGYAGGGYDYVGGGAVVVEPDVSFYGGFYDRGHEVHAFSHRGSESRGFAHGERRR